MRHYQVSVNGTNREVTLVERRGNRVVFIAANEQFDITVDPVLEKPCAGSKAPAAGATFATPTPSKPRTVSGTPGSVTAPIPGIVVGIPVAVGARVAATQTVAVLEAMKMENAIAAGVAGTIAEILVKPGAQVEQGQTLVKITPD